MTRILAAALFVGGCTMSFNDESASPELDFANYSYKPDLATNLAIKVGPPITNGAGCVTKIFEISRADNTQLLINLTEISTFPCPAEHETIYVYNKGGYSPIADSLTMLYTNTDGVPSSKIFHTEYIGK